MLHPKYEAVAGEVSRFGIAGRLVVRRVAQQLALAIQLETRGVNSFLATARVFDRHDLDIGRKAYRAFRKIITTMTSY